MKKQVISIPPTSALFAGQQKQFDEYGYAPAVRAGHLLYVSGQTALRADGSFPESPNQQIEDAFQRVFEILSWVGLSQGDIVELHSFHVDLPGTLPPFLQIKNRLIPPGSIAWTATGVAALGLPGLVVELKSVALFPD